MDCEVVTITKVELALSSRYGIRRRSTAAYVSALRTGARFCSTFWRARSDANQSFGVFHSDEPFNVVLRVDAEAAADAGAFLFHPKRTVEENGDGSLTVRFAACGAQDTCRHSVMWYKSVTVESPDSLRHDLAELCGQLAVHRGGAA